MLTNKYFILILVTFSVVVMGIVDAVIQPIYLVKSAIKIFLFLFLPFIYARFYKGINLKSLFRPNKKVYCSPFPLVD